MESSRNIQHEKNVFASYYCRLLSRSTHFLMLIGSKFIDSNRCVKVVSDNTPFGIKTKIEWDSTFTIRKIVKYLKRPRSLREICYLRG